MLIEIDDMPSGYARVCQIVAEEGRHVAPRGLATREVPGVTIRVDNPYLALPIGVGRKLNVAIAAAEAAQLVGGVSYPELMSRITKTFDDFRDDGTFHGAYGPRVRPQLPAVVSRLREDPDTRQAIIVLWDPLHDLFVPDSRDYPCTIALQYFVRGGALEAHTIMRSNDVWWGLAYDVFQFTQLQFTIANVLHLDIGAYYHHVHSLHAYERDLAGIAGLERRLGSSVDHPFVYGFAGETMEYAMASARRVLCGVPAPGAPDWYEKTLGRFTRGNS